MKRVKVFMSKVKIVIDTNIFISALFFPKSKPSLLLDLCLRNKFKLVVSDYLIEELRLVLDRPKWKNFKSNYSFISDLFIYLEKYAIWVKLTKKIKVIPRDKKDTLILQTAMLGKADYLITGDKDLLVLKNDKRLKKLKIITLAKFLEKFIF